MKNHQVQIIFKIIWLIVLFITFYTLGWLIFISYILPKLFKNDSSMDNLIIPNIVTFILLILYTKELLIGHKLKSIEQNKIGLLFFLFLTTSLLFIQFPLLKMMIEKFDLRSWQTILSFIIILTSYFGLIINRIVKIKEIKLIK